MTHRRRVARRDRAARDLRLVAPELRRFGPAVLLGAGFTLGSCLPKLDSGDVLASTSGRRATIET